MIHRNENDRSNAEPRDKSLDLTDVESQDKSFARTDVEPEPSKKSKKAKKSKKKDEDSEDEEECVIAKPTYNFDKLKSLLR